MRIASADLVPTEANLLPDYASFAEYRQACERFCDEVNTRPHRATRCPRAKRLAHERQRLHPLPAEPYTAAFGVTRKVGEILPVVQFEGGEYSVPDDYVGQEVWVRQHDGHPRMRRREERPPEPACAQLWAQGGPRRTRLVGTNPADAQLRAARSSYSHQVPAVPGRPRRLTDQGSTFALPSGGADATYPLLTFT